MKTVFSSIIYKHPDIDKRHKTKRSDKKTETRLKCGKIKDIEILLTYSRSDSGNPNE